MTAALRGAAHTWGGMGLIGEVRQEGPTCPYRPGGATLTNVVQIRPSTMDANTEEIPVDLPAAGGSSEAEANEGAAAVEPEGKSAGEGAPEQQAPSEEQQSPEDEKLQGTPGSTDKGAEKRTGEEERRKEGESTADPGARLSLWEAIKRRIANGKQQEQKKPPSLAVIVTTCAFASLSTLFAFTLSYAMLLLVVKATGWTDWVAKLGPAVPDVAALAAAVMLVARVQRSLAWTLLVGSTGMSIAGNLAGHAIQAQKQAAEEVFPDAWSWVGGAFSIFMPVVMAFLVHASMEQIATYQEWKAIQREKAEQRRQAEEAEQRRQAELEQRRQALLEDLPKPPRKGASATQEIAHAYATAHQVTRWRELQRVLKEAGFSASESGCKKWMRTLRESSAA